MERSMSIGYNVDDRYIVSVNKLMEQLYLPSPKLKSVKGLDEVLPVIMVSSGEDDIR